MKLAIFGATGALGSECLRQCVDAGHQVTVLVRDPARLDPKLREAATVLPGDGLNAKDVAAALSFGAEAVLFAVGVDKQSPDDLCTDVTRNVLDAMRTHRVRRLIWCGGGSTLVSEDRVTLGARFVALFASVFMRKRHRDKKHQLELLETARDVEWVGLRPLQMVEGEKRGDYRVGFDRFSGLSKIHFADCADAMIRMIDNDTWLHRAPIIQY